LDHLVRVADMSVCPDCSGLFGASGRKRSQPRFIVQEDSEEENVTKVRKPKVPTAMPKKSLHKKLKVKEVPLKPKTKKRKKKVVVVTPPVEPVVETFDTICEVCNQAKRVSKIGLMHMCADCELVIRQSSRALPVRAALLPKKPEIPVKLPNPTPRRERKVKPQEPDIDFLDEHGNLPYGDGELEDWHVYCNQCRMVVKQLRFFCVYCENDGEGQYTSFDLCLWCFTNNFPWYHEHPRSTFAKEFIFPESKIDNHFVSGELVKRFVKDVFDEKIVYSQPTTIVEAVEAVEEGDGYLMLETWRKRRLCAMCNDDEENDLVGKFNGPHPFVLLHDNADEKKLSLERFWIHENCAKASPEVYRSKAGNWYNVSVAVKRGRRLKCAGCKEKGATVGCFATNCRRSYHLACTKRDIGLFNMGIVYWCPRHVDQSEASILCLVCVTDVADDAYKEIVHCDNCRTQLQDTHWYTCIECKDYFHTFDLCNQCYDSQEIRDKHEHLQFIITCMPYLHLVTLCSRARDCQRILREASRKVHQPRKEKGQPQEKEAPLFLLLVHDVSRLAQSERRPLVRELLRKSL
jgi:hypothetical protein